MPASSTPSSSAPRGSLAMRTVSSQPAECALALFEDALSRSAVEIREAAATGRDPLDKLRIAVDLLYRSSEPKSGAQSPLFTDFAIQLLVSHPDQVATAHLPLLGYFTELVEEAVVAGQATSPKPRRTASLIMQTAMFTARAPSAPVGAHPSPISAQEVWAFCLGGITGGAAAPGVTEATPEVEQPVAAVKKAPATPAARKTAGARKTAAKSTATKPATARTPRSKS